MERYIPVAQTRPKPPRVWLLFFKRAVLGRTILSNGKGHFGLTDRIDQTGQSGQPRIFRSDQTEMVRSHFDEPTEISGIWG